MKRKNFSILITLVMAAPAAAQSTLNVLPYTLVGGGNGTSVWSTVQKHTGNATLTSFSAQTAEG